MNIWLADIGGFDHISNAGWIYFYFILLEGRGGRGDLRYVMETGSPMSTTSLVEFTALFGNYNLLKPHTNFWHWHVAKRIVCIYNLWGQWKYWQAHSWTTGPKILLVEPCSWCFCLPIFLSVSWSVIEQSQVALLRAKSSWKHGHLLPGVIGSGTCQYALLFRHCHVTCDMED